MIIIPITITAILIYIYAFKKHMTKSDEQLAKWFDEIDNGKK